MRMWCLTPEWLCRKHLLGEHVEMHMFVGSHKNDIKLDGYINTGLLEPSYIAERHDQLVAEMTQRGYNHKSPIDEMICEDITDTYNKRGLKGNVNWQANLADLTDRCDECAWRVRNIVPSGLRTTTIINTVLS